MWWARCILITAYWKLALSISDGHPVVTYRWYSVRHQEDGCGHGRSLQAGSARCPDPRSRGRWMSVALRRQVTPGLALSPFTRYYHSLCKRELVSVCHKWSSADYHGVQCMCAVLLLAFHAAMLGNKVWNIQPRAKLVRRRCLPVERNVLSVTDFLLPVM